MYVEKGMSALLSMLCVFFFLSFFSVGFSSGIN